MANIDRKNENNTKALPLSFNWKDVLMIGLFLVGAGGIIYSIRQTDKNAESSVSTHLIEKVENQQIAQVENPVVKETQTQTAIEVSQPVTTTITAHNNTEAQAGQTKKVESPLSGMETKTPPAKTETREVPAADEQMVAKGIETPVKPERGLILATDVKAREGAAPIVPAPKVEAKPAPYTPSKTAGNGNFFLIAASRSTMPEAMKAVEDLKKQGFAKPIILEPSKEAGTSNFRIFIYRDIDRAKVDAYKNANADKVGSYWVWQKK